MRARVAAVILVFLALGGCVTPAASNDTKEGASVPPLPAEALPWSYLCGEPGYAEVAAGVCATGFADPAAAITEPALAVDPSDPHILAVGVNRHDSANVLLEAPERGRPQMVETEVWTSADGGATWTRTRPPDIPEARSVSEVDPALAFDADGRLHYSALLEGGSGEPYVYYTSTDDLGATWSAPVSLAHGGTSGNIDRNWLSLGPDGTVYVTWQAYPVGGGVATSRDGGVTWDATSPDEIPCVRLTPVAVVAADVVFACKPTGVVDVEETELVFGLEANGTWQQRGAIAGVECDGALLAPAGEIIALACLDDLYTSADGGRTWSEPLDVLALATVEDGWPETQPYAISGDARGLVHVLLASRDGRDVILPERNPVVDERVAHVVLDPRSGTLHHEARLTASDPAALRRVPPVLMPAVSDDYFGLAPTQEGMYLAWTRDRGIDVAFASAG